MGARATESTKLRAQNINLRVTRAQKALIDRAAQTRGRSRSDFMLDAACREAESVLLDQCYFQFGAANFKRFLELLDAPPEDNPRLARLLQRKPAWEK